ncbi:MAG TPA: phosphate acyltransferase PlsX [Roseimicrobium sp.]|nr:phosphate acyltransferase PlsX [Roseimicrobium sp.]
MGADLGPAEILAGALEAAPLLHEDLLLVGDPAIIQPLLPANLPKNLYLKPASQVVEMHEKPLETYKKKKDSSIMVGIKLVKDGHAKAFVSPGNTGAVTATAHLALRQIAGLHRPAIATEMPNRHGGFLILDTGASPDIDPEHLIEFALMGRAYAQKVMGRSDPKVHLVNIGEEEGKGNAFAKQAYNLLKEHSWFSGNIEGKDMFNSPCDVVVCDAFVGNVVLKTSEGIAEAIMKSIRDNIPTSPLKRWMYAPMRSVMGPVRKMMDYSEVGGSSLLGLNGICTICHGRSTAKAIKNALLLSQRAIDNQLVETIRRSVHDEMGDEK